MSGDYKAVPCNNSYLERKPVSAGHERFYGWCGQLKCTLQVLTPLCINTWEERQAARIQGATIKGMVRSVAEIISQSCFRIGDRPGEFASCTDIEKACTCCRLFGGTFAAHGQSDDESSAFQGKVFFEDTYVPSNQLERVTVHVSHQNGSPDPNGRRVFPHSQPDNSGDTSFSVPVVPMGTVFMFGVEFECLDDDEIGLLLYSLALEPIMAHKMGFMKSRGLGSIKITITELEVTDDYSVIFLGYDCAAQRISGTEAERFIRERIDKYLIGKNLNESEHLRIFRELMVYDLVEREEG